MDRAGAIAAIASLPFASNWLAFPQTPVIYDMRIQANGRSPDEIVSRRAPEGDAGTRDCVYDELAAPISRAEGTEGPLVGLLLAFEVAP
jgi:hypothetical protein